MNLLRILPLAIVLISTLGHGASALSDVESLNGNWVIDEDRSDTFDAVAQEFSKALNEMKRRATRQKFSYEDQSKAAKGQFHGQAQATAEMIKEDTRSISWDVSDEVRAILEAKSIKLYQARMCAILYDNKIKRLLTINPAGKAYSVSGHEITTDDIGRSLTYVEGNALVINTDLHDGDQLLEHYELDPGARHLNMKVTLKRRGLARSLEFVRVYGRRE